MNLYNHIKELFERNEKFCHERILLKNNIVEAALKLDVALLTILLNDKIAKQTFFVRVEETVIFDKIKFQKFISNKQFLPDSYTAYKNRIGLTADEKFLTEAKEVLISWPYKDCVLEGGQSKEDQKRGEVFWNETLATEDIDRLFQPKAFTDWKRFEKDGSFKTTTISKDDNLIIRGNNLIALHSLAKVYKNKVKLIYIDPPYNTGNDGFLYNDAFSHSTWLTFMKNRLEIAWQLLTNDGSIFIQVDDGEFAYLKVLCDEIFGRENFRETIVLKSSTESGVNAINVKRGERLFKVKEYILFYAKSRSFRFNPFYTKTDFNTNYKYEVVKNKGGYLVTDLSNKFKEKYEELNLSKTEKDLLSSKAFENYALANAANIYSLEKNIQKAGRKFKDFASENKKKGFVVEPYINSMQKSVLMYDGGVLVPLAERIVAEEGKKHFGLLASDLWVDIGTTASSEGGIKFNNGKKPEKLLSRILEMATNEGDLVLDYHLGSGTTAAVAHKMNRKYIGIEQLDYGENDSIVRLQNVIRGDQTGISKKINWKGGGSFVYTELAKNNAFFIEKIEMVTSEEEILTIYNIIVESPYTNYKITNLKESYEDFKILSLHSKKKVLIDFLDKNEMYVNFSEMEDETFAIDEHSKRLTKLFYT